MIVKLLTEHHLEFLSLKGDCRGSSESKHVKIPQCWKSHALAHSIWLCKKYTTNFVFELVHFARWKRVENAGNTHTRTSDVNFNFYLVLRKSA